MEKHVPRLSAMSRPPVVTAANWESLAVSAVDAAQWTAIIPAAGRGSRLEFNRPKILYPVAGRMVLEWLLDFLLPFHSRLVFVLSRQGRPAVEKELARLAPGRCQIEVQEVPSGMGDAVEVGLAAVRTPHVSVVWGDQVALRASSVEAVMRVHQGLLNPEITCPTVHRANPYIHFQRDEQERISSVLQAREGDAMPPEGESDAGFFCFQTASLRSLFEEFRASPQNHGWLSGEFNLLPLIPLASAAGRVVLTPALMSVSETIGVNSAADAALVEKSLGNERSQINVVLFSGGSGTHSITEALRRHPQIDLCILINAYDDGHSTGRLRKFIPSMLGPSDVRKNINRLMPVTERGQQSLQFLSDWRLRAGAARHEAVEILEALARGEFQNLPSALSDSYTRLSVFQARRLGSFLATLLEYFREQEQLGRTFDFTDCAIGNLLFAGCYLEEGRDFNRAIAAFSVFHEVRPDVLLNISLGENLFLVAEKEDGSILRNESDIVATQNLARITELYLVDEDTYRKQIEPPATEPPGGWIPLIRQAARTPQLNPRAAQAIAKADVIIYGPGTQHSSLFPSYGTEGAAEAIAANTRADKIFVGNIHRDFDIQQDDINDLARKFMHAMSRRGSIQVEWRDLVTQFFVQNAGESSDKTKHIPFDSSRFPYSLETVRLRDYEAQAGQHAGGFVLDEVQQIVQSRMDIELQRLEHMVSIVIPVLNEERTIETVLREVSALDLQPLGLTKEIILVDGGSTDNTCEIAQRQSVIAKAVKVLRLPSPQGRGAALRYGIDAARGTIIAFFPGDHEYQSRDLHLLIESITRSRFRAVFGTRSVKVSSLSDQLKKIYQGNRGLYLISKYGGMMLSIATLFLYDRYITDILTSVKAFDAGLLRSLDLTSNGRELDTEIVAKLARRNEFMLELPVDYFPRTRGQGKKITTLDGLRCLMSLIRYRF